MKDFFDKVAEGFLDFAEPQWAITDEFLNGDSEFVALCLGGEDRRLDRESLLVWQPFPP